MMNAKSRAYKVIGMRVVDIVNSLFPSAMLNSLHPKNGKIIRSEFFILWNMISSPDDATEFLDAILAQLLNFLDSKLPPTHGVTLDTLVNTIAFIVIFLPFKTNSKLIKDFLDSWNAKTSDRDPSRDSQSVRAVVRLLSLRINNSESEINENILGPLIIGATTLHTAADFARLNSIVRWPTVDESEIRSNEYGFAYSYLMQLVSAKVKIPQEVTYQQSVLSLLISKTLTLSQQMKMNPFVAQCTLLACLHMIRQILAVDSITSSEFLCKAISTLQPYFLWPEPLGSLVCSVIELLQAELLSPGSNRREALLKHFASVDWNGAANAPGYRYCKPIFYLYDSDDISVLPALNIIDAIPYDSEKIVKPVSLTFENNEGTPLPPIAIQAQIVIFAINCESQAVNATGQRDFPPLTPSHMNSLTANQISHFYAKIREIDALAIASSAPFEDTREDRSLTILQIRNDIESAAKTNGSSVSQSYFASDAESPYNPALPAIEHVRIPVNIRSGSHSSSSNADFALRRGLTYPSPAMYDRLHELFQAYSNDTNKGSTRDIYIVVAGDDVLLHHVSSAYYLLRKLNSELLASFNVHFCLAPFTRNHMAGYIARHDSWYMRHIYTPFRSNALLVPWLGLTAEDANLSKSNNSDPTSPVLPTVFFRDCITQYARESASSLDAVVYQVEGFEDERSVVNQQASETIPFLQRVELGHSVQIEEFCARNPNVRAQDVGRDKTFVPLPLELNVKFTALDLSGTRQPEILEDSASYSSLLLSSVPRKTDLCFPADPTSIALELHASASKADRSKLKKNILISEPKQHVADVTVASANGVKFKILVDGTLFGPFYQVRISPASLPGESVAKFSIRTFFPINSTV